MLRSCHCPFKSVSLQSVNTTNTSFTRRLQWQSAQLEWTWVGRVCFVERETKWAWFLSIDASHTCVCVCLVRSGQVSASVCVLVSPPRPAAPRTVHATSARPAAGAGGRPGGPGGRRGRTSRAAETLSFDQCTSNCVGGRPAGRSVSQHNEPRLSTCVAAGQRALHGCTESSRQSSVPAAVVQY